MAGLRTPVPLTERGAAPGKESTSLERSLPEAFRAVAVHGTALERHFRDMQDVEFTIEDGKAYILQTRAAKRTPRAAVRVAVDMVAEGMLSKEEALLRVDASSLEQLLQARLPSETDLAAQGIAPAAIGLPLAPARRPVESSSTRMTRSAGSPKVRTSSLVRQETSADDIHGMRVAKGVVTAAGGMTSHAAVIARGLGKCCVVGCGGLQVDFHGRTVRIDNGRVRAPRRRSTHTRWLDGPRIRWGSRPGGVEHGGRASRSHGMGRRSAPHACLRRG